MSDELNFTQFAAFLATEPTAEALHAKVDALKLFTDECLDRSDPSGITLAIAAWQTLRTLAESKGDHQLLADALYCESNAHATEAHLALQRASREYAVAMDCWRKQRELLLRILVLNFDLDPKFESSVRCNYANCLSHSGRTVEAVTQWLLARDLDIENLAAPTSYAQATVHLARYFPRHQRLLLDEAYNTCVWVLAHTNTRPQYYGNDVFDAVAKCITEILEFGGNADEIRERVTARRDAHAGYEAPAKLKFFAQLGLLLTVAPDPTMCASTARDEMFLEGLGFRTEAEARRLLGLFNHLKEDFSFTRYLLMQYLRDSRTIAAYSAITDYAIPPDSGEFGLRPALVKAVVRSAVDALDRVSKFLEALLNLPDDNPGRATSFNTVWYVKKDRKHGLKPEFAVALKPGNPLAALYDMHLTWDMEDGPFKSLRDLFVHDVGELSGYAKTLTVRNPRGGVEELDLQNLAIEAVRLLRGAITACCQLANAKQNDKRDEQSPERSFRVGVSLSDRIDLGTLGGIP